MRCTNAFFLTLLLAIIIVTVVGCTKETPQTPFARIQGKWKLIATATDDNGDGIIESGEQHPVPVGTNDLLYFKVDSTGTESTTVDNLSSPVLNFRWMILYSDSLWVAYTAHDTITYYISELNLSDLTLATNNTLDSSKILTEKYYIKN